MIDTAAMIFSLGMVIIMVLRASRLDRVWPWFGPRRDIEPAVPSSQDQL